MMKVSDPIIFSHVVSVFFKDLIRKHQLIFNELGVDFRNGVVFMVKGVTHDISADGWQTKFDGIMRASIPPPINKSVQEVSPVATPTTGVSGHTPQPTEGVF